MRCVRTKSMPVPIGIVASSAPAPARTSPFTTSFRVPSPPTATTRPAPSRAARSASSIRCPGRSEKRVSPSSPRCEARFASAGQRLPVTPLSDAGLTRKTVSPPLMVVLVRRDRGERDARHPVDGGAELLVADAREDALDDDVGHGQQAACLDARDAADAADRGDGEERGGLHLDREHAAARPALVLALARVVEDVARDDRPDVHLLADRSEE